MIMIIVILVIITITIVIIARPHFRQNFWPRVEVKARLLLLLSILL